MSDTPAQRAAAVRRGAGVFPELRPGIVFVRGGDRSRWLNGMLSADVAALAPGPDRSGVYALLLSPKGRILADLHVLAREDAFWLETDREHLASLIERLERYVVADDVLLEDASERFARVGIEGPAAPALVEALLGAPLRLAPDACADAEVAGARLVIAAYGWSGEPAFQLFAPPDARERLLDATFAAGGEELVRGDAATLEVLRIEAGRPRLGAELDEEVLPAEAGLVERAVSLTKGCFTGQEIVARLESRGQVNHRLVGLRFEGDAPPQAGTELVSDAGRPVGEVTSVCISTAGAIGLGYARLPFDAPGTRLLAGSRGARVAPLPLVPAGGAAPPPGAA